jgi:hypothetical protein
MSLQDALTRVITASQRALASAPPAGEEPTVA